MTNAPDSEHQSRDRANSQETHPKIAHLQFAPQKLEVSRIRDRNTECFITYQYNLLLEEYIFLIGVMRRRRSRRQAIKAAWRGSRY